MQSRIQFVMHFKLYGICFVERFPEILRNIFLFPKMWCWFISMTWFKTSVENVPQNDVNHYSIFFLIFIFHWLLFDEFCSCVERSSIILCFGSWKTDFYLFLNKFASCFIDIGPSNVYSLKSVNIIRWGKNTEY